MRRCGPSRLAVAGNQRQTFVRTDIMATKAPIKATFSPDAGLLSVFGDDGDNVIVTSRDAAGQILVNGGDGFDTAEVNGGNASETFTIAANGARVRFDRVSPAFFFNDTATTENL